jgi:hypothetical protein
VVVVVVVAGLHTAVEGDDEVGGSRACANTHIYVYICGVIMVVVAALHTAVEGDEVVEVAPAHGGRVTVVPCPSRSLGGSY